jgi:hypothetical protein
MAGANPKLLGEFLMDSYIDIANSTKTKNISKTYKKTNYKGRTKLKLNKYIEQVDAKILEKTKELDTATGKKRESLKAAINSL